MPLNPQLYSITFSSPEYKTLGAWINDPSSPIFIYKNKPDYFLDNIVGEDGLTNRQRIHSTFKTPDTTRFINSGFNELPIKPGLILYLEYSLLNQIGFVTEGIQVVSNDEAAFKAAKLAQLESDEGYVSVTRPINGKLGVTKTSFPGVTVWLWCRALSPMLKNEEELTGQLFDLTPFVIRLSTSMAKNGGNWNLALPPLMCELDKDGSWGLKRGASSQYINNDNNLGVINYVAHSDMFEADTETGEIVKSKFLFNNIIGSNDLIFIRFDTLEMEKQQRYEDAKRYIIDKQNLSGRIYDMIGLVSNVTEVLAAESNNVEIHVSGQDLSKLFIEDGSYFFALENSQGILKVAGETRLKNSLISRNYADGGLRFLNLYMFQSISSILKFIFQQLSNIKVIPNDLLSSYGENRNTRFNEFPAALNNSTDGNKEFKPQFKKEVANGIWQIVDLVIDENITNRRLCDSSMSGANGSLMNFMRSVAMEPLVEMYMDTYSDHYTVILRKPPYDQKGIITLIEGRVNTETNVTTNPAIIDISCADVLTESLSMNDSQVYSWYHFFPKGSLLNTKYDYSTSILPAIYFDEYAQIWGSKPFQQANPYIPFVPNGNGNGFTSIMERQAFYDLKYVIESSQYLPFSRKGTITMNRDRRIKIGNIIRYTPSGEIYFVESVQHNHSISDNSIDATTTIQVSRGLVESLIYGINYMDENGVEKYISYFSLIDTTLTFRDKEIITDNYVQVEDGFTEIIKESIAPQPILTTSYKDFDAMLNNVLAAKPGQITGIAYMEKYNAAPERKALFTKFINEIIKAGYNVIVVSTSRTYAQQAALKAENPNNASPGQSKHEFFSAIDISVEKNGRRYGKNTSEAEWRSTGVPFIATSLGLQWGGAANNGTFGNYIDRVHFQIPGGGKTSTVKVKKYKTVNQPRKTRALDTDAVFSKFKTNIFCLNFFMKKLQFSSEYRVVKNRSIRNPDGSLPEVTVTSRKN